MLARNPLVAGMQLLHIAAVDGRYSGERPKTQDRSRFMIPRAIPAALATGFHGAADAWGMRACFPLTLGLTHYSAARLCVRR